MKESVLIIKSLSPPDINSPGLCLSFEGIQNSVCPIVISEVLSTPTSVMLGPILHSAAALLAASLRLCSEPMLGNTW